MNCHNRTRIDKQFVVNMATVKKVYDIRCSHLCYEHIMVLCWPYLLIFPFCLQQNLVMVLTFRNATLVAHGRPVLPAVVNQRLFMAIAQQQGSRPFTSPHDGLSTAGAGAVCSLSQHIQVHVALEDGPGVELLIAHGALKLYIRLAPGVPVGADAHFTERVTTWDGRRDSETLQAYGAGQVAILRIHL